ncbi:MAG: hypothetical protein ABIH71_07890 [Candidatus Omnitrophota bacterium]|nr:hypothetical protein [Candidatus Omnitrophota bacterium]
MSMVMEHMDKKVDGIAQQYETVIGKLQEHDAKFERIDQRFDWLEMAMLSNSRGIKANSSDIKRIEQKLDKALDRHEKRIQKVETKVEI